MNQTNGLKALALVIAIILWAYVRVTVSGVTQNPITQLELRIPLELKGYGSSLVPYEISTDTITITVRGDSDIVNELGEGMVRAYVDLKDVAAGSAWPEVQVIVPGNVSIMNIDPKSVNVKLSPRMAKEVPIKIETRGKPKAGFKVGTPVFEPKVVEIEGPEELVRQVATVLGVIQVEGISETFSASVRGLVPINENRTAVMGKDVALRMNIREIQVTVPVEQKQTVESIAVGLQNVKVDGQPGFRYDIEVDPQFVEVASSLNAQTLPQTIDLPTVTFVPKGPEVVSKIVVLPTIDGISYMGKDQVKLTLIPHKVESKKEKH